MKKRIVLMSEENKSVIAVAELESTLSLVAVIKVLNDAKKELTGSHETTENVLKFIELVNSNDEIHIELDYLQMIEFYL